MNQDLRVLCEKLCRELAQCEQSAVVHPAREARRLGNSPPARALVAISEHARSVRPELELMCKRQAFGVRFGQLVGKAFSAVRTVLFDQLIDAERSYRGTLLGVRHGIDLARLLREVAMRREQVGLVQLCDRLLVERVGLVEDAEDALGWFAEEPSTALRSGPRSVLQLAHR